MPHDTPVPPIAIGAIVELSGRAAARREKNVMHNKKLNIKQL